MTQSTTVVVNDHANDPMLEQMLSETYLRIVRRHLERSYLFTVLNGLRDLGWEPYAIDDGGDEPEEFTPDQSLSDVLDAIDAVDESDLYVRHKQHGRAVLCIVLGNEWYAPIADCSAAGLQFGRDLQSVERRLLPLQGVL